MDSGRIHPDTLRQLIANCRKSSGRFLGFPRDWCPHKIPNPEFAGFYFSDASAWEFIADTLQSGHTYSVIELDNLRGDLAITFVIALPSCVQPLYVKVQVGVGGKAIGRSFHLSERY